MPVRAGRFVISVLILDRVGVLRDVTSAITDLGGNIDGMTQTVVAGYFTAVLSATFRRAPAAEALREAILERFRSDEASVTVRPHEAPRAPARAASGGDLYIVTLTGPDRPGVLKTVTTFFAERGINIEDWYMDFAGAAATYIGEITVPAHLDLKQVQDEFRQAVAPLRLTACLQQANIFRATNEIGPIKNLLGDGRHA